MVKRLLILKNASRDDELSLKKQNKIVLIRVHLETGRSGTEVQRFKVALIREIWLNPYGRPRDSFCILDYPGELACTV